MTDDDLKYWTPGDMKAYLVNGLRERLKQSKPFDKTRAIEAIRELSDRLASSEQRIPGVKILSIKRYPDGREEVTLQMPAWIQFDVEVGQ